MRRTRTRYYVTCVPRCMGYKRRRYSRNGKRHYVSSFVRHRPPPIRVEFSYEEIPYRRSPARNNLGKRSNRSVTCTRPPGRCTPDSVPTFFAFRVQKPFATGTKNFVFFPRNVLSRRIPGHIVDCHLYRQYNVGVIFLI